MVDKISLNILIVIIVVVTILLIILIIKRKPHKLSFSSIEDEENNCNNIPKEPEPDCIIDDDCLGTEICINGECIPECVVDEDCPENEICTNGECVPECVEDEDCPENEICTNGECVPECVIDEDCPGTEICMNGECVPECVIDEDCPGIEICTNGECADQPCTTDEDCSGDDEVCRGNICVICSTQRPVITAFTGTSTGIPCDDHSYFASWTAVPGATSYDLLIKGTTSGGDPIIVTVNDSVFDSSITDGVLRDNIDPTWCAGFTLFLHVRANTPCISSGTYSNAFFITGAGPACCV